MNQLGVEYHRDGDRCDEAENLMSACGLGESYQKVNIETDLELLKRYGIHVPVLQRSDLRQELFWPFDQVELAAFLGTEE